MKDDLPDLTPYLSKKGGNSQGKGADNPAGKADISSKLSALVKKTDTPSAANADAVSDSASDKASSGASSSNNTATSSSSWEQVDSFSSSARFEAEAEAMAQEKAFAEAAAGINGDADYTPAVSEPTAPTAANSPAPSVVPPATQSDNSSSSQSGTFSTSGNFSTSGTFSTKPMASRPGGPGPAMDRFKAPQARPMNTLSTGSAPIQLKVPEKEPTRAPAPYTFHPTDPPREAVVPKSMQLPTPSAPTTSAPGPAAQAKRAADVSKDPPPSWPAQPSAPQRIVEKVERVEKVEKSERPERVNKVESVAPAQPAPLAKTETTAELLAKAFQEEAKALENNSDDLLESVSPGLNSFLSEPLSAPDSSSESNNDAAIDSKYDSPYFESKPAGLLGFGNLLSSGAATEQADVSQEHSNLADLMIPTGEHQALFAPERRGEDENLSPFDEVQPAATIDETDDFTSAFAASSAAASPESLRVDEKPAPAFSSLFSTEIVTSGQDFSHGGEGASDFLGDIKEIEAEVVEQPLPQTEAVTEVSESAPYAGVLSQSDAISKLLEAVNKEQQSSQSTDISSSFSDPSFTESSFAEPDDMRTADTMFGSGGSNKGSAEELSAADAVFGAVEDIGSPSLGSLLQSVEPTPEISVDLAAEVIPPPVAETAPASSAPANAFLDQPALGKDSLPMAFADSQNFEQESLESIKQGIRKAKAEEKARKKAEEAAKAAEAAAPAESISVAPEAVKADESIDATKPDKAAESQSPKSTAKLSLTEMIELANSAKLEQVNEGKPTSQIEPPASSGLSALLSGAAPAEEAKAANDDEDEGDSLGGAISDALDKLLAAGQEELSAPSPATANSEPSVSSSFASSSFSSSFSESVGQSDPQNAALAGTDPSSSQNRFEAFASTPNQLEEEQPLTQTQANKVDALSRLLEVASKAPNKSPDDKRTPSDSASKIAAEVNKPPGKISRQVETISASDYGQPGQSAAMSAPFGGSSPFSSPFNSPSASQTRPASQDPSVSSGSGSGMANPYDGVASMPQATVSNDAVSARIAALNRKLEEQSRPPSASAVNMEAMAQIQQQAEFQAQSQSQSGVGTSTGSSPSVNSLSQLPPQVDDSPSTRAELVNRILGSAKISQHGTKMPELPTRTVAESITPDQTAAIRGGKNNSQAPNRKRARVARMPGFDIRPVIAIVVLLVILGGGYYAYSSGIIKVNLPDIKSGGDTKVSVDQLIKSGDLDRAREILEAKVNSGKISASEGEKLHALYYQMANKVDDEDPSEAIKLLEKIPSRSKKFKDAQKLLRKLKRKVKHN